MVGVESWIAFSHPWSVLNQVGHDYGCVNLSAPPSTLSGGTIVKHFPSGKTWSLLSTEHARVSFRAPVGCRKGCGVPGVCIE